VIRWLTVLLFSVFGISLIFISLAFQVANYEIKDIIKNQTEIYVLSGIIYLILTLSLLQFPNVLYGLSPKKIKEDHQEIAPKVETKPTKTYKKKVKYTGTVLERINQYLESEKPYLSRDFSVFSMAVAIGLAETQINNCIKNEMKTSFVKLRTQLRVKYALSLLENKSNDKITIEAIGEQSGFKTRSNFYAAFKEVTGLTPTEFIQQK
jgi:AraC-like DNA-binding protein